MNNIAEIGNAPAVYRDFYQAHGYNVVRRVVDTRVLEQINYEIGELFARQVARLGLPVDRRATREALQANAVALLKADTSAYISTARLTQMIPVANQLMVSELLVSVARQLGISFPVISTRVSNHIMSDDLKIPNGYHKSPPHQDWRSMQGSLDSMVFWVPTTPVTAQSHPLEVVPGSHLLGLLTTMEHIMTPTVDDPRITEDVFVPLSMDPGDLVVFSSFLVHRTGAQGDGKIRIAFSGRFNNADEASYVEHSYPTPYRYSYQTELIYEGFPTLQDLSAVFPAATDH
jgi:ectoine hydroxylase-related dioxygenase (phytanoyl-CoA dioxygenase family)